MTWRPESSSVSGPNIGCTEVTRTPAACSAERPARSGVFSDPTSKTTPAGLRSAIASRTSFAFLSGVATTIRS